MNILACQIAVPKISCRDDKLAHLQRVAERISEACSSTDIDLVVLPELASIDYSRTTMTNIRDFAEDLSGDSHAIFEQIAAESSCFIAYGIPRIEGEQVYVSQVVVGPQGEAVTHYDKLHLAQFGAAREKEIFTAGNRLCVFEPDGMRAGIIICYDFRFPELTRMLALEHGCDLILHPVGFTRDISFASWHHFVICRALENQVYFLSLNRAGPEWGKSIFCPPWINSRVKPTVLDTDEAFCVVTVEPEKIVEARKKIALRDDRLPDYSNLRRCI